MLKILQQSINQELLDVKAGFRKSRGTRDQIANTQGIIEKEREFWGWGGTHLFLLH